MKIMKEVEVGLEKDNIETITEEMIEVAVVDIDQVQKQVPIESDKISVGIMIISQKTVQHQN